MELLLALHLGAHLEFLLVWALTQGALFVLLRRQSPYTPRHLLLVKSSVWFLVLVYLVVFLLALAGQLSFRNVLMATAVLVATLSLLLFGYGGGQAGRTEDIPENKSLKIFAWTLSIVFLLWIAVLIIKAVVVADGSADGLWYHIPRLYALLQEQGLAAVGLPHIDNYHPKGSSFWLFWVLSFYGGLQGLTLATLPYLFLCIASIYSLGRSFDCSRYAALAAALSASFIPVMAAQFGTSLVDVIQLAPLLAAVAILWSKGADRAVHLGLAVGLLLAAKLSGLLYAVVILLFFVVTERRKSGALLPAFRAAAVAATFACILGGYTYFKNYYEHSNPFYPQSVDVLGVHLPGPGTVEAMWESKQAQELSLGQRLIKSWTSFGEVGYGSALGGFGVMGPVLLVCLLLWLLDSRNRADKYGLALLCLLLLAVTPFPYVPRFTLFVPALGAVGLAGLLDRYKTSLRFPVLSGVVLVVALFAVLQQLRVISYQASHGAAANVYNCEGESFPAGYSEAFAWLHKHPERGKRLLVVSRLEPVANACFWNLSADNEVRFLFSEGESIEPQVVQERISQLRPTAIVLPPSKNRDGPIFPPEKIGSSLFLGGVAIVVAEER